MLNCRACQSEIIAGTRWCGICHANLIDPSVGRLASPGKRLGAHLIDILVPFTAFFVMISIIAGGAATGSDGGLILGLLVALALSVGYLIWALILFARGTTPGKNMLNMRVIKENGGHAGFGTMFIRELIGKFISGLVFSLGFFWILFDPDRQGWHDKLVSTFVVEGEMQQRAVEAQRGQVAEARAGAETLPVVAGENQQQAEEADRRQETMARAEAAEARRRQAAEARAEAETSPGLQRLASVPEPVELLPYEALNDAQRFLTRQGYEVAGRTDHSLTVRQLQRFFLPDSTATFTSIIEVLVHPQQEGGVRIDIMGHDFDPVPRQQQAQWTVWADSLPKRMGVEDVVISDAVAEPGGGVRVEKVVDHDFDPVPVQPQVERNEWEDNTSRQMGVEDVIIDAVVRADEAKDTDGERDISDLLECFEAAEDRWGVKLDGLFAEMDHESRHIHLNGELHASDGGELGRDIELVATTHDSSGRVMRKQSTNFPPVQNPVTSAVKLPRPKVHPTLR